MNKICSVPDCNKTVRSKGLCGKHYERVRAHGNVYVDNRATGGERCSVEDCSNRMLAKGMCNMHYARFFRHGHCDTVNAPYGTGTIHKQGYVRIHTKDGYRFEHVLVAEKALGKKLPEKAVVHHLDKNPLNNSNANLVVCPSQAYHFLLHRRAKEIKLYGRVISTKELGETYQEELKQDE